MTTFRLSIVSTFIGLSIATPVAARIVSSSASSEPMACTMDAKLCPDGSYVGRDPENNCAFRPCPGADSCAPYKCNDGTEVARCAEDGTVINYFAEPCLTHGGEAGPFKDVPANHANANAIAYVKAEGIVEGYADGTFKPDITINRAEFVKILAEASYSDEEITDCPLHGDMNLMFSDVARTAWFVPHLCTARLHSLIQGYSDGMFKPANPINFAEAAKILAMTFHLYEIADYGCGECGPGREQPWYEAFVKTLEAHAAIPLSIDAFDQKITRGEMAEMIWRLKANVTDLESQTYDYLNRNRNMPETLGEFMEVTVYLYRTNDSGVCADGSKGCYEAYVPTSILVPKTPAVLKSTLNGLLQLDVNRYGCYSACETSQKLMSELYLTDLSVTDAWVTDGTAHVRIDGDVSFSGIYEYRAIEQIQRTVLQFPGILGTDILVNGEPLRCLSDGSGMCE